MEPTPTQLRYIKRSARKAARDVLAAYAERSRIPVNPIAIARSMGLRVFESPLPGYAWGMILGNFGGTAHIYFDENLPPVRARYACAHELGHYVANNCALQPCMGYQCGKFERNTVKDVCTHKSFEFTYTIVPMYEGNEMIPREFVIDIFSSNGYAKHIVLSNGVPGKTVNYTTGEIR